jgi:hypothetical protein
MKDDKDLEKISILIKNLDTILAHTSVKFCLYRSLATDVAMMANCLTPEAF